MTIDFNIEPLKDEVKNKFNIDMYYAIFDRKSGKYLKSSNQTPIFSFQEFKDLLDCKEKYHKVLKYKQITINDE